jgi:hypothetical protein
MNPIAKWITSNDKTQNCSDNIIYTISDARNNDFQSFRMATRCFPWITKLIMAAKEVEKCVLIMHIEP